MCYISRRINKKYSKMVRIVQFLTDRGNSEICLLFLPKLCESKKPHSKFSIIQSLPSSASSTGLELRARYGQLWFLRLVLRTSESEVTAARDMKGLSTPHGLCGDRERRVHDLALLVTFPMIWVASRV